MIVCCYNSEDLLYNTLNHLATQSKVDGVSWEVIIVDNNSSDGTTEFAYKVWQKFKSDILFKVLNEMQPGLSYARRRGISESAYEYVIFCDDDNHLNPQYIQTAYELMCADEKIGMIGGKGFLPDELEAPPWFDNYQQAYAIGPQGTKSGDITDMKGYVYGAGAVLRKSAWEKVLSCGFQHLMSDRSGKELSSGGDIEMCYALRLAGYRIWYDERLQFVHAIDPERLNIDYLNQLQYRNGRGRIYLNLYSFVMSKSGPVTQSKGWIYYLWHVFNYMLSYLKVLIWDELRGNALSTNRPAYKYYLGLFAGSLKAGWGYVRAIDQIQRLKTCLHKNASAG